MGSPNHPINKSTPGALFGLKGSQENGIILCSVFPYGMGTPFSVRKDLLGLLAAEVGLARCAMRPEIPRKRLLNLWVLVNIGQH